MWALVTLIAGARSAMPILRPAVSQTGSRSHTPIRSTTPARPGATGQGSAGQGSVGQGSTGQGAAVRRQNGAAPATRRASLSEPGSEVVEAAVPTAAVEVCVASSPAPIMTELTCPSPVPHRKYEESLEMKEGPPVTYDLSAMSCNTRVLRDECNFIQNVGQFYNQQDISDVILKIGQEKFYGHKFVLAKSSEVFRTMLYNKNWTQAGLPEIELEETDECRKYFDTFLRFLYTAEVNISVESAVGILCLADKYSVTSLKNLCTQYMVEHTRSPLVKNALNWYAWSKALVMEELIHQCSQTIAWNAEQILASPEWEHMDMDFVSDILRNGDLVVQREYVMFASLLRWLDCEEHTESYVQNAKKLLPLIRFPQMQVHELYEVEQSEMYRHTELHPLLDQLVNKAYRFRSLCPSQADIGISFQDDFYLPRNYLDLAVDTVRMQNNLRYGMQVDVRTYVGPVPSNSRDGEWKIAYRKTNDNWTLQLYCHESALVGGEARVQSAVVITNQDDQVVQVEESDVTVCSRGNHLIMPVTVFNQDQCKSMIVLMKPLPK